jgi:hypothetical protein
VAELQQRVVELGSRSPSRTIAASFERTLGLVGQSQEAPATGTATSQPSPAPTTFAALSPAALNQVALNPAALASSAPTPAPALDLISFGDDGSSSVPDLGLATENPGTAFTAEQLLQATQAAAASSSGPAASTGQRALAIAQSAIGVAEDPPGSNDGPGLATFRSAVAGAAPGQPWCAYFVSWAAQQAGAPIGDGGAGIGSVEGIADWAGRTGRLLPAGSTPASGDLVLFGGRHVGIVENVNADGTLTTVEGNYRNAVERVRRSPLEATGYVRLG